MEYRDGSGVLSHPGWVVLGSIAAVLGVAVALVFGLRGPDGSDSPTEAGSTTSEVVSEDSIAGDSTTIPDPDGPTTSEPDPDPDPTATTEAPPSSNDELQLIFYGELGTDEPGKLQIYSLTNDLELDTLLKEHDYANWRSVGGITLPNGQLGLIFYGELGTDEPGKLQIYSLTNDLELDTLLKEHDYANWRSVGGITLPNGQLGLIFYGELGTDEPDKLQIYSLTNDLELDTLLKEHDYANWRSVGGITLPNGQLGLIFYGELGTDEPDKLQIYSLTNDLELDTLLKEHDYANWRSVGGITWSG